jgi:hypothetical protein
MTNAEQTLRLLGELERLDKEAEGDAPSSSSAEITAAAVLEALIETGFNLTTAILGARNGT